jgi:peptidoglycan/LPS O-acetylase OafA/YrhL
VIYSKISAPKTTRKIPSIALDVMRLCSALTVLLVHAKGMWLSPAKNINNPSSTNDYAHAAVVIFFVLSGYVISFSTDNKNRGHLQYIQARLSRLYSVVLPGLLITAIAELLVENLDNGLYESVIRGNSLPRYLITGAFLNEIWFFSATPPINGPLWSLGYEFWYYVIFGCWFFRSSGLKSMILPLAVCLIAGPKILIMMPIWLLGVFVYRAPRPKLNHQVAWLLALAALFVAYFSLSNCPPFPGEIGSAPLFYSGQFLTDLLLGFLLSIVLWLLPVDRSIEPTASSKGLSLFREVADLTFPIYVLHFPLLILYKAIFGFQPNSINQLLLAIVSVFSASALIGYGLNKSRRHWNKLFEFLLTGLRKNANDLLRKFSV